MIPSIVNPKAIHKAMQATVDPYESALDSGMDFAEPETPEPEYFGSSRGCFVEPAVPLLRGLARSERKFGVEVIGVLDKKRINGYYRCNLLCLDGSILEDDMEKDELKALPELHKGSAFNEWLGGGYPTDPIMEAAFFKTENKDKLSSCVLCGRTLTHPISVKRHVGPECYKRVTPSGNIFVQGDEVAQGLIDASRVYSEERFQKWVIRSVLTLNAPLPQKKLEWLGKESFGYSNKPSLYYLDSDAKLNCVEIKKKRLTHRQITSLSTCKNDLDYRAWGMVKGEEELVYHQVAEDDLSPYMKAQWIFFDGTRRTFVYHQDDDYLWCTCRQPNCTHLRKVREAPTTKRLMVR
jgi:hypothetical protein